MLPDNLLDKVISLPVTEGISELMKIGMSFVDSMATVTSVKANQRTDYYNFGSLDLTSPTCVYCGSPAFDCSNIRDKTEWACGSVAYKGSQQRDLQTYSCFQLELYRKGSLTYGDADGKPRHT